VNSLSKIDDGWKSSRAKPGRMGGKVEIEIGLAVDEQTTPSAVTWARPGGRDQTAAESGRPGDPRHL